MLTVIVWSAWTVATSHAIKTSMTAFDLALFRYGIPACVLAPVILRHGLKAGAMGWRGTLLMGLGAGLPFQILIGIGMRWSPAANAGAMLSGTMPMFAALLSGIVLGERFTMARIGGFALILGGVGLLGLFSALAGAHAQWHGYLVLMAAAASWAIYTVTMKRAGVSALHATAIVSAVALMCDVGAIALGAPSRVMHASLSEVAMQVVAQGLFAGLLGMTLFAYGVRQLGASRAAAFISLIPGVVALMAVPLLGETIGIEAIAGIAVVSVGVALASGAFEKA
ncbi:MAG: DMT family transporter [Hyphomicrobiaceae bacterium]